MVILSPVLLLFGFAVIPQMGAPHPSVHSPAVEKRLNYLVGDWIIEGLSETTFSLRCTWSDGRAFVVCSFRDQRDKSTGQTIFGYSESLKRFTYYRYDSMGRSIYQLGFPTGNYGVVFTDERQESQGTARVQTTFNLIDEGLHYTQYRSLQGRDWERTADVLYVPGIQANKPKTR